ncbi:MAG: YkvA family protein [Anaeromicrobium sp.]|jgi:uncharacterized membrane protein YkvA (DUF1232 family)|uniref:YkvA family protein n=1 Tax=Anaeromicrobium sp. TaxID=1929132 RepID=UPI0025F611BE|nr:YkvA family protein [Anaeromicrobium sp.]MCT4595941.1 YkvA family protein [Anaeromicrobium sp.]
MKGLSWVIRNYRRIKATYAHLKNPSTSIFDKILILFSFLYLINPADIIADPVLGIGIIDDMVVILFLLSTIGEKLDKYPIERNNKKRYEDKNLIKDVEYEVFDKENTNNQKEK